MERPRRACRAQYNRVVVRTASICVAAALSATSAGAATSAKGTIEGVVTDKDGEPLAGATVIASSTGLAHPVSATTRADGRYRIAGLPEGTYRVSAVYQKTTVYAGRSVELAAGSTKTVDRTFRNIALTPAVVVNATISGSTAAAGHRVENATDGDLSTTWCDDANRPKGLTIDLGQPLTRIELHIRHPAGTGYYRVFDGATELASADGDDPLVIDLDGDRKPRQIVTIMPVMQLQSCVSELTVGTRDRGYARQQTRPMATTLGGGGLAMIANGSQPVHAPAFDETKPEPPAKPSKPATPAKPLPRVPATTVTEDQLAKAPDAVRAIRLALDDCDTDSLSWWIAFPLRVGDASYEDAPALATACAHGDLSAITPTAAALDVSIEKLSSDTEAQLTLPLAHGSWRLAWRKGQWWLVGAE